MVPVPEKLASLLGSVVGRPVWKCFRCCFDGMRCLCFTTFEDVSKGFISGRVFNRVVIGRTAILGPRGRMVVSLSRERRASVATTVLGVAEVDTKRVLVEDSMLEPKVFSVRETFATLIV